MREVAWALAYAHGRGIVHPDVKPDNILLEGRTGRALVTDFGIAHGDSDVVTSDPGRVIGTAHSMSPEMEFLAGRWALEMLYPEDGRTMINNCRVLRSFGSLNMGADPDPLLDRLLNLWSEHDGRVA